jgi:S-adenosylmethionine-diacylgycerolhomoserine-N-methlytransferase
MPPFAEIVRDLKTVYHLVKPVRGNTHQERLENFYSGQAENYDLFRQRLLQGREKLYQSVSSHDGEIWIDFGGGTGANFEAIGDRLSKFAKIYIVDLCPSLLEVAGQRKADRGWTNVEVVESDVTRFVPPEGKADLITFSYSLTMIPNWFAAIDQAHRLLKPGGILGVVDFYAPRKHPPSGWRSYPFLMSSFWQVWFGTDNVFLSRDHAPYLHHYFEAVSFSENMANLPFLPGLQVPYYQFIGQKNKECYF